MQKCKDIKYFCITCVILAHKDAGLGWGVGCVLEREKSKKVAVLGDCNMCVRGGEKARNKRAVMMMFRCILLRTCADPNRNTEPMV